MNSTPFLWTNDDITAGQAAQLRRQLDFLDAVGVPGTFFVVPMAGKVPIDQDEELLNLIRAARRKGHEFYQHGTRHAPFECGVPETWMLDFSPKVRRQFDEERLEIEKQHTFEAFVRMLSEGRRIWLRAFGEESAGFRPGWGAFHTHFYRALDALGYQWVSSRMVSTASWLWNQGQWDAPMLFREALPMKPCLIPGTRVVELPITGGDYAFGVPNAPDKIAAMVELGVREFAYCRERGIPFVMVSHWHGLERNEHSGYAVHRRLLPRIREAGGAEFMTMSKLYEKACEET